MSGEATIKLLAVMNEARMKGKEIWFFWPENGAKRLRIEVMIDPKEEVIYRIETDPKAKRWNQISVYDLLNKMDEFQTIPPKVKELMEAVSK